MPQRRTQPPDVNGDWVVGGTPPWHKDLIDDRRCVVEEKRSFRRAYSVAGHGCDIARSIGSMSASAQNAAFLISQRV
jgi:hypothetical protein